MDISQEALEATDSQSDDSAISDEVNQPYRRRSEALGFLHSVRLAYGADSKEYVEFSYLMHEYENERTNNQALQLRIRDLFKENPELVADFDTLIPVQDQNENSNLIASKFGTAIAFVSKVQAAYRHDKRRYISFLDLLNRYRKSPDMSYREVFIQVCNLFHDREDLIVEFAKFLPDSSISMTTEADNARRLKGCLMAFFLVLDDSAISYEEVTQPNPKNYLQAVRVAYGSHSKEYAEFLQLMKDFNNRRTNIQAAYRHDERRYKSFLDLMARYRNSTDMKPVEVYKQVCNLFHDRQDLIVEFTRFLPDPSHSMTTEADNERKLNRRYIKWRKGGVICLMAFSLVLSLVLAFGMGIGLGNYQSES
ncbi:hypothetical protein Vadar_009720 [Vaccinium darrowii]|uniref:Uncharacterized protein n=1 Tax=Vaccinium darrowii TaxID=229202 RepID=A0ACB7ZIJ3_9ERIC|nr:hypothetical protein Vadar_009720 [Vaccinium darrowii]